MNNAAVESPTRRYWRYLDPLAKIGISPYLAAFGVVMLLALALRLWDLGGRPIHYDEGLHAFYSWQLFAGDGYRHEPWIHGPLQFFLNSAVFGIFWDSDYTVRLTYVFFGVVLVGLPYFLRDYIGRTGALLAAVMLAFSPALFYFSRYSRNDIYMAVFALGLAILMWRYIKEGKDRYLYMASAVLALAFASKETAYIIVAIFGLFLLVLAVNDVRAGAMGRFRLSNLTRPGVFLLLLVTLTLPQWAALASALQGIFGESVVLAYSGDDTSNPTGLPLWGEPFVNVGVFANLGFFHHIVRGGIAALALVSLYLARYSVRYAMGAFLTVAALALLYAAMSLAELEIARNYLIAGGVLVFVTAVSVVVGLMWQWRIWLLCAGIFYTIWLTFYTAVFGAFGRPFTECPSALNDAVESACSRFGGAFTGVWQGLGYWLAQQDVARGNQPWYYYLLIGSVYEFLPLLVGVVAIIYYLRKRSPLSLFLVFWSVATFGAYTVASEKMPWLLVNITLPFIILSAKFLGETLEGLPWRRLVPSLNGAIILVGPLLLAALVNLTLRLLEASSVNTLGGWLSLATVVILALGFSALVDKLGVRRGLTLGGLGVVALLLVFTAFVGLRTAWVSDDETVEMIVYAGASAEIRQVANDIRDQPYLEDLEAQVHVDYELWYPLNWYVRKDEFIQYQCYEDKQGCQTISAPPTAEALLLLDSNGFKFNDHLTAYKRGGSYKELLWFPEVYRRPGERRKEESIIHELWQDVQFAADMAPRRSTWKDALDYILYRRIDEEWWDSKFYTYQPRES